MHNQMTTLASYVQGVFVLFAHWSFEDTAWYLLILLYAAISEFRYFES